MNTSAHDPQATPQTNQPDRRSGKIASLQAARAISIVLVVICHSSAFLGQDPGLWHRTAFYLWLRGGALGVQIFFVISGMVIFAVHRNDLARPQRVAAFLWKRFRRIYPIYWVFLTLTIFKHREVWETAAATKPQLATIASNYLLIRIDSFQTIMVQAWTLFDEVQFYLVFALCILNRRIGVMVFGAWLAASILFLNFGTPYEQIVFSPYHLLFALGMLVMWIDQKEIKLPAGLLLWLGSAVLCVALVLAGPYAGGVPVRLGAGAGAACLLLGAVSLERQGRLVIPRWLILLGDASYAIYLVHFMVLSAVARFAYAHWGHRPVPSLFWLFLFIATGLSTGIAAHLFIEKPLLRVWSRSADRSHQPQSTQISRNLGADL